MRTAASSMPGVVAQHVGELRQERELVRVAHRDRERFKSIAQMYSVQRALRIIDGPDEVHRATIAKLELAATRAGA